MTIFFRDSEAIGGSYFKYTMSWIFAAGCCKICLELAPFQGVAAVGGVVPLHGAARYLWQCGALGRWWRLGSAVPKSKSAWLLPNFFLLSGVYAGICFCPRRVLLFYLFGCYRYLPITCCHLLGMILSYMEMSGNFPTACIKSEKIIQRKLAG